MLYVGTSGYQYRHWDNGVFYPPGVKDRLSYIVERVNTIEINSSFYNIPRPETVASWAKKLPKDFPLVLKAPRSVTHNRRLRLRGNGRRKTEQLIREGGTAQGVDLLDYFFEGFLMLPEHNRGPVLVQLPARMQQDLVALRKVLTMARAYGVRVALEVRHPSWFQMDTFRLLERYEATLVSADWSMFKTPLVVTSDILYVRRHGPHRMYTGLYSDDQLHEDLEHLYQWTKSHSVYVFFNNDDKGYAPANALRLLEMYAELKQAEGIMMSDEY
jgi:uncharacterized protein YecE (DUF72 family)